MTPHTSCALTMMDPRSRFALRAALLAFAVGLILAFATSAGIAAERVTRGSFGASLVANAGATIAAILALVPTMRHRTITFVELPVADEGIALRRLHAMVVLVPQVVGAVLGVTLVHALVRHARLDAPWLSEKPAQLMNDAVAVAGLLALVWAAARELDARILVLALVGVTMYRLTAPYWHLDAAVFQTSVQQLVVAELVAAAFALGLFRFTLSRRI